MGWVCGRSTCTRKGTGVVGSNSGSLEANVPQLSGDKNLTDNVELVRADNGCGIGGIKRASVSTWRVSGGGVAQHVGDWSIFGFLLNCGMWGSGDLISLYTIFHRPTCWIINCKVESEKIYDLDLGFLVSMNNATCMSGGGIAEGGQIPKITRPLTGA